MKNFNTVSNFFLKKEDLERKKKIESKLKVDFAKLKL